MKEGEIMGKILNFGSLNIDLVYSVTHFVQPKETISSKKFERFCGGKGSNQSVALARAGANVFHAGCVGTDGNILIENLRDSGANVDYIKVVDVASGNALIQVEDSGENCIVLYGGANMEISLEQIDEVLVNFEKGDYLLLQNEISNNDYIINKAYDKGMIIVLNPSPMNEKIFTYDLNKVAWFILNEVECMAIADTNEIDKAMQDMREKFSKANILLTLGEKGSILYADGETIRQDIFKVVAVDTTAAGDTFTGYFLTCLMRGVGYAEALKISSKASSICVSKKGASNSIPKYSDVVV